MADQIKQIKEFPQKPDFGDDDLLLIQGQGTTYNVQGRAVKKYAEDSAKPQVELASQKAQAAAEAADRAEAAIQHPAIPDPSTGNWKVWDQVSESYQETTPPVRAEGQDFEIKGYYPTLEALEAAVPDPEKGYAYGIGTEAPYDIYVWDMVHGVWVNNGPMTASGDMLKSIYDPKRKQQDIFAYADGVGLPAGGTPGQIPVKKTDEDYAVEWQDPPEGVGHSMAGQTVEPTQGTMVTAGESAEIFNDYRAREFSTSGNASKGNIASGRYSHAEGTGTTASGRSSHAEGSVSIASGACSHAEVSSTASGNYSHSEGNSTASGDSSHAEGFFSIARSMGAHAEGGSTVAGAEGDFSLPAHAEGYETTASGNYSHAEGYQTIASGSGSHATGYGTIASAYAQIASGEYNVKSSSRTDKLIIGKGGSDTARANCFRATHTGVFASGNYSASGADYAELFEWLDGNPDAVDRVGRFVTLDGAKIRLADPMDDYILGIVSGSPSVVGDVHDDQWQGMYLTDIFGRPIWEDVEVPEETKEILLTGPAMDENGEAVENSLTTHTKTIVVVPAHTKRQQKLNPEYDVAKLPYSPRSQRPEWDAVGLLGKLVAVDDGTCRVNGWATVGEGGAATLAHERTKFRVMERLDEKHIRIMILP